MCFTPCLFSFIYKLAHLASSLSTLAEVLFATVYLVSNRARESHVQGFVYNPIVVVTFWSFSLTH